MHSSPCVFPRCSSRDGFAPKHPQECIGAIADQRGSDPDASNAGAPSLAFGQSKARSGYAVQLGLQLFLPFSKSSKKSRMGMAWSCRIALHHNAKWRNHKNLHGSQGLDHFWAASILRSLLAAFSDARILSDVWNQWLIGRNGPQQSSNCW